MLRAIQSKLLSASKIGALSLSMMLPSAVSAGANDATYTYDGLGRLTTACDATPVSGDLTVYRFDAAGNRQTYQHSNTAQIVPVGNAIYSPNGKIRFFMQGDGNLAVSGNFGAGWIPLGWASNTVGSGATEAAFQPDGNLVVYNASGPVWDASTWHYHCATLSVQDDGNVVIRDVSGQIVWQTNTGGH